MESYHGVDLLIGEQFGIDMPLGRGGQPAELGPNVCPTRLRRDEVSDREFLWGRRVELRTLVHARYMKNGIGHGLMKQLNFVRRDFGTAFWHSGNTRRRRLRVLRG